MTWRLIGKNFTPPDVRGKVTGEGKYANDFRVTGMTYARLLLSPMPHARIKRLDTKKALALPGVIGILTADDLPEMPEAADPILTREPVYVGEPILAIAAESEEVAANALDLVELELEPLPFTVDPLESLYPGGPDARSTGNVIVQAAREEGGPAAPKLESRKWTAKDFAEAGDDQLPMGKELVEWSYGDVDAAFRNSALTLDESFVTASTSHLALEPRSALAYWQNGKCYVHGSTQSQTFVHPFLARYIGIKPDDLVYIAEFCGGGFGSKGSAYPIMSVPAHLSKKIGRPVMLRISRTEEYFLGSARPGFQGRVKMAFSGDGKVTGVDLYIVQENGPYGGFGDIYSAAETVSLMYTPGAMRFRGIPVETNTPPRGPQRGPGTNQIACAIEPLLDKAAAKLELDRLKVRLRNAPNTSTKYGGRQGAISSAYLIEATKQAAEMFNWEEKKKLSGRRNGSKVTGIGIGQGHHSGGASGFDGLVRIMPNGFLHIHTGVGNLGTYSHSGTSRVAAEILNYDWERCLIQRGDSRKNLPWNFGQFGSNTSFTMARTNYVAAMDARAKLLEIAAMDLGGAPEDFELGMEVVVHKSDPEKKMTYADCAKRAIALGGKYDGHEMPDDINPLTKSSVTGLAGTGLIGVAKDNLGQNAQPPALAVSFIQIELDLETGRFEIVDYVCGVDCGTVIHPLGLSQQVNGGSVWGFGMAAFERHVYDPQNGLPANVGLYQHKPPTILDLPVTMRHVAVDKPDPQNPVGTKGIGEPPMGSGGSALLCAISDALGGHYFNRTPVTTDMILYAANGLPQSHKPLAVNTF